MVVRLRDGAVDLVGVGDAQRLDAVGLAELDEVRLADRHGDVVVLVEQLLPLADHAEIAVVDDRHLHRQVLVHHRGQLLQRHLEAAVAADRPDQRVRLRHLRAHRGGHLEAHRAEAARGDQLVRVAEAHVLRGPHLVLADAGDDHRLVVAALGDALDHALRGHLRPARDRHRVRVVLPHLVDPADPVEMRALPRRVAQLRQHVLDVPEDRDGGRQVLAVLAGVDVDVDQLGVVVEVVEATDRAVVHAVADADHEVGVGGGHVRLVGAVHAHHPVGEDVRARDAAEAEQRVEHGDAGVLGELPQLLPGLAEDHAVAGDDQRPLGRVDQLGGPLDRGLVGRAGEVVAADGDLLGPDELGLVDEDVLGDVDVDGAGPPGGGEVGGLGEGVREVLGVHHEVVVLDARRQDAGRVGLLEAVPPDQVARDVAGDEQRRHRVHHRVLDRRDEVRRARPGGGEGAAEASRRAGVAVGGVAAALLVAHQDVAHLGVGGPAVVEREHDPAGVAEYGVDAHALQTFEDDIGAAHSHRGFRLFRFGRFTQCAGCGCCERPAARHAG